MKPSKIKRLIESSMYAGEISNDDLVQFIELCSDFLNLKTIPDYVKENNISYNGVKHHRTIREIRGVKFVIDNE